MRFVNEFGEVGIDNDLIVESDEDVRSKTRLDSITTVVDARHLLGEIDRAHEAQEQIAFADTIILNKIDLVNELELAAVEERIRRDQSGGEHRQIGAVRCRYCKPA